MKRFILTIMLGLLSIGAIQAQSRWCKATELAIKFKGYDWSDWESVNINVEFDLDKNIIVIYSKEPQVYKIIDTLDPPYDPNGEQVKFSIVDQDFDNGTLRLRIQNDGYAQLYVDFADVSWVYNIVGLQ